MQLSISPVVRHWKEHLPRRMLSSTGDQTDPEQTGAIGLATKRLLILMFNFTNRLSSGDVYVCSCVPTVRTALVSAAARLTGDFLFEAGNGRKYFHQLVPSCHGALKK